MNHKFQQQQTEWKGMTLDEIRYARVINEMRILMSKERLSGSTQNLVNGNIFSSRSRSMVGRMLGALSWLDYGLIAIRLTSKFSNILRHKRK